VNKWMDEPVKQLGPRHRIKRHNALTPIVAGAKFGSPKAAKASALHIGEDLLMSAVKKGLRKLC
jgi:hypothetical protein